jgi:hypothetical protein
MGLSCFVEDETKAVCQQHREREKTWGERVGITEDFPRSISGIGSASSPLLNSIMNRLA